jgi:transposase
MLDERTRSAIFRLHGEGHGTRAIADVLGISRGSCKQVLREGRVEIPRVVRAEKAEPHRELILELHASCKGNLVRVHEELALVGAALSYQALTAFCRRHGIGYEAPRPAGRYHFEPAQEMQHDTSPHEAEIGGRVRRVQTASVALCYSRMLFVQCYPRFTRFECKVFLTDALIYFGGAAAQCMVDNTSVIRLSGTGRDMVPVPEMVAFGERFGFVFRAHEVGDANRSARVERPFDHIEKNFLAGRSFRDWRDINAQARAWCDKVNAKHRRHLHASPRELFAVEQPRIKPLPIYVPDVYALHHRIVDSEGYVNVNRNRYSAPYGLIGREVEVRETKDAVEIFEGPRQVGSHIKELEPLDVRVTDPSHRPPRNTGVCARRAVSVEERRIGDRMPEVVPYIALLKQRSRGSTRDLRWLIRMVDEYPREAFTAALAEALRFGMADLERLERMVLRRIARDFFILPRDAETDPETDER